MQAVTTIGLDIAKSVFQVHGVDAAGQVLIRRQLKRRAVLAFFQKLPVCLVGIEACASSHYWSRELNSEPSTHGTNSDEPIIARYVRSLGWSGLSTDDASWAVHDPTETLTRTSEAVACHSRLLSIGAKVSDRTISDHFRDASKTGAEHALSHITSFSIGSFRRFFACTGRHVADGAAG